MGTLAVKGELQFVIELSSSVPEHGRAACRVSRWAEHATHDRRLADAPSRVCLCARGTGAHGRVSRVHHRARSRIDVRM